MQLRIFGIANDSIVDGPGIRFTVFAQGCPRRCKGCHNPDTHDFNGGYSVDTAELLAQIRANPLLDGVTFSGGEPFCQASAFAHLAHEVKILGLNVITYTGYEFEYIYDNRHTNGYGDLLEQSDYLIDGEYIESQNDWTVKFRGSSNQRYIDCKKSLHAKTAVLAELPPD